MPRASKKEPTIDKDAIYVCWMGGSALVDGQDISFQRGQRLRGDSPVVHALPHYFARDGDELPNTWTAVNERRDAERPPGEQVDVFVVDEPLPLEREDVVVLTRSLLVGFGRGGNKGTARYEAGTVFSGRSEIAGALPDDAFEASDVQFTRPKARRR